MFVDAWVIYGICNKDRDQVAETTEVTDLSKLLGLCSPLFSCLNWGDPSKVFYSSELICQRPGLKIIMVARRVSPEMSLLGWERLTYQCVLTRPFLGSCISWWQTSWSSAPHLCFHYSSVTSSKTVCRSQSQWGSGFQHRLWKDLIHTRMVNYCLPFLLFIKKDKIYPWPWFSFPEKVFCFCLTHSSWCYDPFKTCDFRTPLRTVWERSTHSRLGDCMSC